MNIGDQLFFSKLSAWELSDLFYEIMVKTGAEWNDAFERADELARKGRAAVVRAIEEMV